MNNTYQIEIADENPILLRPTFRIQREQKLSPRKSDHSFGRNIIARRRYRSVCGNG